MKDRFTCRRCKRVVAFAESLSHQEACGWRLMRAFDPTIRVAPGPSWDITGWQSVSRTAVVRSRIRKDLAAPVDFGKQARLRRQLRGPSLTDNVSSGAHIGIAPNHG